ncbi:MAG: T9SS type A sorting domain-containing protein [Bacteroidota bacterium]|nr:T9SS type A sorting domain-containing protein [Bacteroidota bacterium]
MKKKLLAFLALCNLNFFAQTYTSYFTGNPGNIDSNPSGGICMMGGATEHDEAMKWFLQRSDGGDILVLRASGSNGYNNYLYSGLGITVNSVETIVFNSAAAANDPYVQQKISQAEAIWFAGGDQWDYISYWRGNKMDSLINDGLVNRNIVIGGTSAGMAIQGKFYFSAANGSVTTAEALMDPYNIYMTVDSASFLKNRFLEEVITDTHYDNPDRKGRHVAFLARIYADWGIEAKGIACDEYTAVCIDANGIARCYGDYPAYDEDIYFLQTNCELINVGPENCSSGNMLDWNQGAQAVKVYRVKGTQAGNNTFSLVDWQTGVGGTWENWHIDNGTFYSASGNQLNCAAVSLLEKEAGAIKIYPNPINTGTLSIEVENEFITKATLTDISGKQLLSLPGKMPEKLCIDISWIKAGLYFLDIETATHKMKRKIVIE